MPVFRNRRKNVVVVGLAHELENDVRIHAVHGWASSQIPHATEIKLHPLTACNALCHVDVVHWELKRVIQVAAKSDSVWTVGCGKGLASPEQACWNRVILAYLSSAFPAPGNGCGGAMWNNIRVKITNKNAAVTALGLKRSIGGAVFCKGRGCPLSPNNKVIVSWHLDN